jgi:hypothetical protein
VPTAGGAVVLDGGMLCQCCMGCGATGVGLKGTDGADKAAMEEKLSENGGVF